MGRLLDAVRSALGRVARHYLGDADLDRYVAFRLPARVDHDVYPAGCLARLLCACPLLLSSATHAHCPR